MSRKLPQSVLCLEIKLEPSLALLLHLACNLIKGINKGKRMYLHVLNRCRTSILVNKGNCNFVHLLTNPRRFSRGITKDKRMYVHVLNKRFSRGIILKIVDEGSSRLLNKHLQTCVAHVRQFDVLGHGLVHERAVVQDDSEFAIGECRVLHLLMGPHFCQGRNAKTVLRLAGAQKLGLLGRGRLKVL